MENISTGFVSTLGVIVATITRGWAFRILWGWFVARTFGLQPLTIPQALGLALVVSFVAKPKIDTKEGYSLAWASMSVIAEALLTLGLGWIILQFML